MARSKIQSDGKRGEKITTRLA